MTGTSLLCWESFQFPRNSLKSQDLLVNCTLCWFMNFWSKIQRGPIRIISSTYSSKYVIWPCSWWIKRKISTWADKSNLKKVSLEFSILDMWSLFWPVDGSVHSTYMIRKCGIHMPFDNYIEQTGQKLQLKLSIFHFATLWTVQLIL